MARSEQLPSYTCHVCKKNGCLPITVYFHKFAPYTDRLDLCGDFAFCSVECLHKGIGSALEGLDPDAIYFPQWFRIEVEADEHTGFKELNKVLRLLQEATCA